jgi:hypothetical protein
MTNTQTVLELAHADAQQLRKKIGDNAAKAEQATWADVTTVQADIKALGTRLTTLAAHQADAVQADIAKAIASLHAAGEMVEDKAMATKDGIAKANAALLESATSAMQSLGSAVDAARSRLAHAIEPEAGTV